MGDRYRITRIINMSDAKGVERGVVLIGDEIELEPLDKVVGGESSGMPEPWDDDEIGSKAKVPDVRDYSDAKRNKAHFEREENLHISFLEEADAHRRERNELIMAVVQKHGGPHRTGAWRAASSELLIAGRSSELKRMTGWFQ